MEGERYRWIVLYPCGCRARSDDWLRPCDLHSEEELLRAFRAEGATTEGSD